MINSDNLNALSKEKLIELIEIYAKNWLALDGVWFQSVESKDGMAAAMEHDLEAWKRFTEIEARKLKKFLDLEEHAGIDGLEKALNFRFYANINQDEIIKDKNTLTYRVLKCRVQTARARKGMDFHPCKMVGIEEYTRFAHVIDSRFRCECISCYPEVADESVCCAWRFTLEESGE